MNKQTTGDAIIDDLKARGLLQHTTDEGELRATLAQSKQALYAGFDPTAASLHVGSLLPVMALSRFQRAGHNPVFLVGGATGMIGDPSGKTTERVLLSPEVVQRNKEAIRRQLERFVDFSGEAAAKIVDNNDWFHDFAFVDFLRDVGKYFTVNSMLGKESVRSRLEEREHGISYTEFSYMLMQAYDFLYLFRNEHCSIQAGGSDQWGNIVAGIDLIAKAERKAAHGITFPLITTATGEKFGKSAGNSMWLDPEMTSPYQFYQYWVRTDDRDVVRFLKYFTFLETGQIKEIMEEHMAAPDKRIAQKRLASEVTDIVHGKDATNRARRASDALFGGNLEGLAIADLLDVFSGVASRTFGIDAIASGIFVADLFKLVGLCTSKAEARRLAQGGGLYINNAPVSENERIGVERLIGGEIMVLRAGRKRFALVRYTRNAS